MEHVDGDWDGRRGCPLKSLPGQAARRVKGVSECGGAGTTLGVLAAEHSRQGGAAPEFPGGP